MQNIMVFGSNSTIAQSVINKLAINNVTLYLFARNLQQLQAQTTDLQVRYPDLKVNYEEFDANIDKGHRLITKIDQAFDTLGVVDLVLIAHGSLPDQKKCESDWDAAFQALTVNAISGIEISHHIANRMKLQQTGTIAIISSVAGERGRQSNYIYGTAKGMLNIYLQGLRNSLYEYNVNVLTVMPGFVDTKMTAAFDKGLLWANPDSVANDIVNAIYKKKNIIYTPWFWKYIMWIIKLIPEFKFKKMKL